MMIGLFGVPVLLFIYVNYLRNFIARNHNLLFIIVPALTFWLGPATIGITIKPVYVIAPPALVSLFYMSREIRTLRTIKADFEQQHYENVMSRAIIHAGIVSLTLVLSVLVMHGYTHDKDGVGLLFILVIGLFA